jgi:carbonic anhydrase
MKTVRTVAVSVALLGLSCAWAADHGAPHWDYTGKAGADHWGEVHADFATCKLGAEQSPIDIQATQKAKLPAIGFAYAAGAAEVLNNGHTIQVNLKAGGTVQLESGSYQLLQFHFHTPSEEKINGKAYPLVAHFVHRNAAGQLAVVGVLFQEGQENAALAPVFAAMPMQAGKTAALTGEFQPAAVLPKEQGYYAFSGSLTTPPCSEGVRWQVLKQPVEVSKAQLAAFQKLYPMNARPVQPLGNRVVRVSE